jgi:glyoxylase-like metal-dependent hydrolase (beta-lactamase superfamily II)
MQDEGISPEGIDDVILTHADVDHIGGILRADGGLTFPNAGYILARSAWTFWSNQAIVARWPEFLTFFGRVTLPLIRERIQVVDEGSEFLPGFRFVPAPGHRPGHTPLTVESRGEHFLHLADTVGHPLFMQHPEWHWYADFQPPQAEQDKQRILAQAVEERALVFGSHLPFPGVGRVIQQGETWRWQPATSS